MTNLSKSTISLFVQLLKVNRLQVPRISGEDTKAVKARALMGFAGLFPTEEDIYAAPPESNYLGNVHAAISRTDLRK